MHQATLLVEAKRVNKTNKAELSAESPSTFLGVSTLIRIKPLLTIPPCPSFRILVNLKRK